MDNYLKIPRKYAVRKVFKLEEQYIEEVQQMIGLFAILVCWHICRMYEWLYTVVGLEIGFIDHFQIITTSIYSVIGYYTLYNSLQHIRSLFSLLCLHQSLYGNDFERRKCRLLWVPKLFPCLSYQLLTATAHND
jgi:hypothetical protein